MKTVQTLQDRINENAEKKLRKHLVEVANKEREIENMLGKDFYIGKIDASQHFTGDNNVNLKNEFTKQVYESLLPNFIQKETDDILNKLSEIEYFLNNPDEREL